MATLCGRQQADQLIDYDTPTGQEKMPLWKFVDTIIADLGERFMTNPLAGFFPLIRLTGQDARYLDNAYRFRDAMRKLIEDKKKTPSSEDETDSIDMFRVLIEDDYYKDKPEEIINEVIVMFAAGMKTIQVSTTNVIQFLHFNPEYKKRLLEEIEGPLNEISDDFMTKLTTDVVEDFSFTRNCFYESMRLHPPAPLSSTSCFSKDITINGVHFPKDSAFYINITNMNRDSEEWQRPDEFLPDRFDSESPLYARPDGGKRNPLTFSPFLGGKRICLGKTFAETTIRLTLPLLFYHFDFETVTPDQELVRYIPGGVKDPEVPFRVITKRKMTQKI